MKTSHFFSSAVLPKLCFYSAGYPELLEPQVPFILSQVNWTLAGDSNSGPYPISSDCFEGYDLR